MNLIKITPRTRKVIIANCPIDSIGYSDHHANLHLSSWVATVTYDLEFKSTEEIDNLIKRLQELKKTSFQNYKS